jgi:hypothetical protein
MSSSPKRHRFPSLFWPIMLIGAGAIWLLYNLNLIPAENLWLLLRLWPVLIILAGLNVLFSRKLAAVGAILGLLVIAGAAYILLNGDKLNFVNSPEPKVETFSVEMGNTTATDLTLELSLQEALFHGLSDSSELFLAEIGHVGDINFDVSGEAEKQISLRQMGWEPGYQWLQSSLGGAAMVWDIGLSPSVPFDLTVDGSVGKSELDLSGVMLSDLDYDGGTGASTIILPESREGYETRIDGGTGKISIVLPENSNLTLRVDGGTGQIVFDVPEGAAVNVEVKNGGTGNLNAPLWLTKISGEMDRDEGIYQTDGFDAAQYKITIIIEDIGTGNMVLK